MISFEPLWTTLTQRGLKKTDLAKLTGLSRVTIAKMGRGESVTLDVVDRICQALKVPIYEVVECEDSQSTNSI